MSGQDRKRRWNRSVPGGRLKIPETKDLPPTYDFEFFAANGRHVCYWTGTEDGAENMLSNLQNRGTGFSRNAAYYKKVFYGSNPLVKKQFNKAYSLERYPNGPSDLLRARRLRSEIKKILAEQEEK